jgi:hypothetical protein
MQFASCTNSSSKSFRHPNASSHNFTGFSARSIFNFWEISNPGDGKRPLPAAQQVDNPLAKGGFISGYVLKKMYKKINPRG